MDLSQILEEQQNATKWKMAIFHLFYKKRLVIKDKERQMEIIRDVHRGIGDSEHSKAMASHREKKHYVWQDCTKIFLA